MTPEPTVPLRDWTCLYGDPLESDEDRAALEMSGMELYAEHTGRVEVSK